MILTFVAASLLAAPEPIAACQPSPQDFPSAYLRKNASAAAILELVIDEKGKVESCRVVDTIGDTEFANSFCGVIRRSRWTPAVDVEGQASVGVLRTLVRMYVPETAQGATVEAVKEAPDIELQLAATPKGASLPLDIKVALLTDGAGKFTACEPKPDSTAPSQMLAIACEQALKANRPPPVRANGGELSHFVTELKIRFVQASAAP